ncbi:MAG: hypothetical protein WDN28_24685 [Chthoniobacter sp.]
MSSDPNADIVRAGVPSDAKAKLTVGNGATLSGTRIILDSSHATSLSPRAHLLGDYVALNSGQISLRLDEGAPLQPTEGLVLAGRALKDLQGVEALSLLSYSSIDIYEPERFPSRGSSSSTPRRYAASIAAEAPCSARKTSFWTIARGASGSDPSRTRAARCDSRPIRSRWAPAASPSINTTISI